MTEKGKIAVNTWDFRCKKQINGTEKLRTGDQTEGQSGAKCRWQAQNWTKKGMCQTQICSHLPVLRGVFALEGCCEQGVFCKNILSLRQFGIRWLWLKIPPIFQLPLLRQSLLGYWLTAGKLACCVCAAGVVSIGYGSFIAHPGPMLFFLNQPCGTSSA